MEDEKVTLEPDDASQVDTQYRPFPTFGEWAKAPQDFDGWDSARLHFQLTASLAKDDDLRAAQDVALRAAAFDTGAIEGLYPTDRGLTLTVATQAAAWEQEVTAQSGEDAITLFKAQLAAFQLVMDLATKKMPMTEAWIRRLHEEVTSPQATYVVHTAAGPQEQALPRGQYKDHPNHVRAAGGQIHAYAPVDQTPTEMHRFIDELTSDGFGEAHPLLQASYAHYAFVAIHPFADGNGRVARAIASVYTYRSDTVPLLILEDQRQRYFSALSEADVGRPGPFVAFIGRATQDALNMVTATIETAQAPDPAALMDGFRDLYLAQGDLTHRQLDEVANQVVEDFREVFQAVTEAEALPDGLSVSITPGSWQQQAVPDGYRAVVEPGSRYLQVDLSSRAPAKANEQVMIEAFVAAGRDTASTLVFEDNDPGSQGLSLALDEIYPSLATAARHRLREYSRRLFGGALARLLDNARESMAQSGYGHPS